MKLAEDVTREMLLDVVEWFLEDLRNECKEAKENSISDKSDKYSHDVSIIYQQVDDMLTARLSTLESD